MTCSNCGEALAGGARFCSQCGSAVAMEAAPANDPLRGLLEAALGTHYEIRRELGRGGMGAVFLAYERGLDRDVAIKVLPPDRAALEINRQRFRLEARAAARLSHPNIVPLHTFGEHDGMLYYVMGYVEGESLADRLARVGHLSEHESRRILASLAEALHYAHSRGVLHRDVKPQNILIEAGSNRPLLTDFGISKVATESPSHTSTGMILGTPEYMSPEQASGDSAVDGRSDLYSLGLVGYALLSGELPFHGRTPGELITKRMVGAAPRLVARDSGVTPNLIDTVMRCLARDPAARWPDCAAFARAVSQDEEPDPEPFESVGLFAALFTVVGLAGLLIWRSAAAPSVPIELFGKIAPTLAGLLWLVALGAAIDLVRRGRSVREAFQSMFREPPIWLTWYPAVVRRPGNVWQRLPAAVRVFRCGLGLMIASAFPSVFLMMFEISTGIEPLKNSIAEVSFAALIAALTGGGLLGAWLLPRRLQEQGLSPHEAAGVVYKMPLSRRGFWSRPAVAAILARSAPGAAPQPIGGATRTVDRSSAPTRVD